ncbi:MAG: hypothetical protein ACRDO8_01630 [Nocardioidaceae bacterium]
MSVPAPPPGPTHGWRGVTLTVLATLGIVVSITVGVQRSNGADTPPDDEGAGRIDHGDHGGDAVPGPAMHDVAHLEQLVSELGTVYGTTRALRVVLYADHAVVTVEVPGKPGRERELTYNGVFHHDVEDRRRDTDATPIDLRTVDWEAVVRLIEASPDDLGLRDAAGIRAVLTQHAHTHLLVLAAADGRDTDTVVTLTLEPVG